MQSADIGSLLSCLLACSVMRGVWCKTMSEFYNLKGEEVRKSICL